MIKVSNTKQPNISNFLATRSNSESFLTTQNEEYNTFLSNLRDIESIREDKLVTIREIQPVDLSTKEAWVIKYPNDNFGFDKYTLNDQSIGQLGAKRSDAAYSRAYAYSIPESYEVKGIHGEPVNINLREVLFREAMETRVTAKAVLRDIGGWVKGVVGENYPLDFKDSEVLDQIYKKAVDLGLNPRPSHFSEYDSGAIKVSFMFDNPDFVFENQDAKENFGLFFKNSSYGDSAMGGGSYVYTQICTNGMMGWKSKYAFKINHSSRKSFIKNIIDKITLYRRQEEFKLFSRDYGIDDIALYGDGTNYTTFERIYPEIATGLIFKSIQGSKFLKKSYQKAMETVVRDWRKELAAQVSKHSLGKNNLPTLTELAERDNTLLLTEKEGSMYDISNIFTSAGNLYTGTHSDNFQEAAMQVLTGRNITPLVKSS